jgi:hypothetical protein
MLFFPSKLLPSISTLVIYVSSLRSLPKIGKEKCCYRDSVHREAFVLNRNIDSTNSWNADLM